MRYTKRYVKLTMWHTAFELLDAFILALILGFSWQLFGTMYILIVMNIFAIPLLLWVFPQIWWVNYIIVISWLGSWAFWNQLKKDEKETKK